jgi:hypothetical protein
MMEGLGRLYNKVPIAAGVLISLKEAAGVQFTCTGADTFTVKSATAYNGSGTNLVAITRYYTNTSTAGAAAWADSGDIAATASVTIASGTVSFYIDAADLPAGASWVEVTVGASGLVQAETVDLFQQQNPKLLQPLSGASS